MSTTVNNSQTDLGHLHLYLKIEEWLVMLLGYYFSHCFVLLPVFKNFPWFLKDLSSVQSSSVTQSCLTLCNPMNWLQHARPPYPSPTPRVYSNSGPLSQWCHPTISSSVVPFSSCLQSFPASGSLQMNHLFKRAQKTSNFFFELRTSVYLIHNTIQKKESVL